MLAHFRPHVFTGWLQGLWPLHPLLFVSGGNRKRLVLLVILIKYPKLGFIGPDWSGLSQVLLHEPNTVNQEVKHDEWLCLMNVIQSTGAGSGERERKTLVWLPEGGRMDIGIPK